ncbi:acyltransferase family protein [Streptomyces griseoincarnatus]|uniref:Acyltransferase family protein n=1 Tax=Streptomyces griseoincarnatus TaxID=29305 RepID=A0ABT0W525_STRGI|nr:MULTISPECIES: acyltransferase family protein [Streptomyces]MBJ6616603.1 acyltransferase family protein [Streptomyces sp. I3(2020)]MBJ6630060.1 acyltransferase family protein [Streptomyces sp. I4(2020)]MCM2517929.1 acyltransferase family protein [Streptomyces griseoincarnatus]
MTNSQRPYGNSRTPLPPAQTPADGVPTPRTRTAEGDRPAPGGRQRDAFFDNAKYLAIVLVAVGHAWGQLLDDGAVETAYRVVYTFHMPAFILISGYFSRSFDLRAKHVQRLITGVVVPYVVFETAYSLFQRYGNDEPEHGITLLDPTYHLWFLCALFVWRITTPVWRTVKHPLPVSLVLAALGSVSPQIGDDLELQRVLQFLPFFVLGLTLRPEHFRMVKRRSVRLASVPVFVAAAVTAWATMPYMRLGWLYHSDSAQELGTAWWTGPVMVCATLGCSLVMTVCFLAWVPRRRMWFTSLGAGTIYGYLLHAFLVRAGNYTDFYDRPALHEPLGVLGLTVFAAAAVTLLCTRPVQRALRCVVEPRMEWAFRRDAGEAARVREQPRPVEVRAPGEKVSV